METVDLKKRYRPLYPTGKRAEAPHLVDVPALQYLMIDGAGDPNGSREFEAAVAALYATSYGLKFTSRGIRRDHTVMGLEGLWWSSDPTVFALDDRDAWKWTLMILQPEWITEEMVSLALSAAREKGTVERDIAGLVRLETLEERLSVQVLHIGPYAKEAPTIRRLHSFAEEEGYRLRGKHHEVYLSDPRRVPPERMKTVIRHPVEPV